VAAAAACGALLASPGRGRANDAPNTAFRSGTISLPSVDESSTGDASTVQVNQGRAGYDVPIVAPPGAAGVEPGLSLGWTGHSAETATGAGWALNLPVLRVKTSGRGGQPVYGSGVTYLGLDGEDLIETGTLADADGDGTAETVYHEERDLHFRRYVQLSAGGWRIDLPDGRRTTLGTSSAARIARTGGADPTYADHIVAWLPEKLEDRNGNQLTYTWSTADEADDGTVNGSATSDVARYLTEVRYGCRSCATDTTYQALTFSYGKRSTAGYANALDFSPGFLVEWELYLTSIATKSVRAGVATSVRTTTLAYDASETRRMLLSSVTTTGADGTALPAISFTYTNGDAPASATATLDASKRPGVNFAAGVFPMDFDKDGRVDIVDLSTASGAWYAQNGTSEASFSATSTSITDVPAAGGRPTSSSTSIVDGDRDLGLDTEDLVNYSTEVGDADGDGESGERLYPYYQHEGTSGWAATDSTYGGTFGSDVVRADIDRDGYVDIISTDASAGWTIHLDDSTHDYDDTSLEIACSASESPTVAASQAGVLLGDVNGDDLVDVVYLVSSTTARVWYGRGRGCWGFASDDNHGGTAYVDYTITNSSGTATATGTYTRLIDMDADGFDDLLMVSGTRVGVWTFHPVNGFGSVGYWSQTSTSSRGCLVADFDADGANEVLCSYDWKKYDLADGPVHQLETVNNGLGVVTTLAYTTTGRVAAQHEADGDAWSTNIAAPVRVVSSMQVDDGRGQVLATTYDYRDAYYVSDAVNDRYEFVGFGYVAEESVPYLETPGLTADPLDPGRLKRTWYDVGDGAYGWAMRGEITCEEVWTAGATPGSDDCGGATGALRRVEHSRSASEDAYGVSTVQEDARTESVLEGAATGETLYTQYEHDAYGNVTLELDWGRYQAGDDDYGDDEQATATDWANDTDDWMLRFPARVQRGGITGSAGVYTVDPISIDYLLYDGHTSWSTTDLTLGHVTERQARTWDPVAGTDTTDTVEEDTYTVAGLVDIQTLADGTVVNHDYDPDFGLFPGRAVVDPGTLALETRYRVDPQTGKTLQITAPDGAVTSATYDSLGRLKTLVRPGDTLASPTVTRTYSMGSPESTVTDVEKDGTADGLTTVNHVDGLGRLVCRTREAGGGVVDVLAQREYGALGHAAIDVLPTRGPGCVPVTRTTAAASGRQVGPPHEVLSVDALGRPAGRVHMPSLKQQTWSYGVLTTTEADEDDNDATSAHYGTTTTRTVDGRGRVTTVTETLDSDGDGTAEDFDTAYAWDALDRLEAVTDPATNPVFSAQYDSRGRRVFSEDPDRGSQWMTYDAMGRLETRLDARGETVTFAYDAAGRVSTSTTSDGVTTYHYDTARLTGPCGGVRGRLAGVEFPGGETDWCYDNRGRITRLSSTIDAYGSALEVGRVWDSLDRLRSQTYPDGSRLVRNYGNDGRLQRVRFDGGTGYLYDLAANVAHNAAGEVTNVALGNSASVVIDYDNRLRPWHHRVSKGGANLQDLVLTLDGVGNVTSIIDNVGYASASFDYDDWYRLTEASGARFGGETATYEYDELGNLTNKAYTDTASSLNVGTIAYRTDRIHAVDTAGGVTFAYDDAGNLTDDGTYTYTYDALGALTQVADGGGTVLANTYDQLGRRIVRTNAAGDAVYYFPDFDAEVRVPSGGAGTLYKYVDADGVRIARVGGTFDASTVSGAVDFYATDHLGSPTLAMDTAGNVTERWYGHPFGEEDTDPLASAGVLADYRTPGDASSKLTRRFQGREIDGDTGFYDFGARVYRPDLGRFFTPDDRVPDPMTAQSFNRYSFVRNNPLSRIDPSGHDDTGTTGGADDMTPPTSIPDTKPSDDLSHTVAQIQQTGGLPDELKAQATAWLLQGYADGQRHATMTWGNHTEEISVSATGEVPDIGAKLSASFSTSVSDPHAIVLSRTVAWTTGQGTIDVVHDTFSLSWEGPTVTTTTSGSASLGKGGIELGGSSSTTTSSTSLGPLNWTRRTDVFQYKLCPYCPMGLQGKYLGHTFDTDKGSGEPPLLPDADLSIDGWRDQMMQDIHDLSGK
jgi:RHS repeat-associated protein